MHRLLYELIAVDQKDITAVERYVVRKGNLNLLAGVIFLFLYNTKLAQYLSIVGELVKLVFLSNFQRIGVK